MSVEKMNSEDVFEREIKLGEDFRYFESSDDVIISLMFRVERQISRFTTKKIGMPKEGLKS